MGGTERATPFYSGGNWGTEKFDLFKIAELVSGSDG